LAVAAAVSAATASVGIPIIIKKMVADEMATQACGKVITDASPSRVMECLLAISVGVALVHLDR
jgi:hypothetical protein